MDDKIRIFLSYSWDSDEHKHRVDEFADRLDNEGFDVIHDRIVGYGERIPKFMEYAVRNSDYVIFICTPQYKAKADERYGGVGYENNIITGELLEDSNEFKFIPVLFEGNWKTSLPDWSKGKRGLDYTDTRKPELFNDFVSYLKGHNNHEKSDTSQIELSEISGSFEKKNNGGKASSIRRVIGLIVIVSLSAFILWGKSAHLDKKNSGMEQTLNNKTIISPSISEESSAIEPLNSFPFSDNHNIIFSEPKEIVLPTPDQSGNYSAVFPIDLYDYDSDKVPQNKDIHGFIINDIYYCNDDDSETNLSEYNYYDFVDYWLVLHTAEISLQGSENFTPDFSGATIMVKEAASQKAIVVEENYLANSFITFQCSTGNYIIEIEKNGIVYTSNLIIDNNEKMFLGISEDDHYFLPSKS